MIRSMTAYASAETNGPAGTLAFELRTVNHRYLEQSLRLPDELRRFEPLLRERVAARLSRGKVELNLRVRGDTGAAGLDFNDEVLNQLQLLHRRAADLFPRLDVDFAELLRFPGLLRQPTVDQDALEQALREGIDAALDALTATREREGAALAAPIGERLGGVEALVADVRGWLPEIREGLRTRLESRLADIKQPVEPGRLEQELVLQLTRMDVDEELDRLAAHIAEARRVLALDEPVGRRLDFLMQEFNREANTLGSKSVDARSTRAAVELKVLIEQMREQVQNIE